jgi:hypothetical protein
MHAVAQRVGWGPQLGGLIVSVRIGVPETLVDRVSEFIKANALAIDVVKDGGGAVQVVESEGRQPSDPSTLQAGGWIACADAFDMASNLGIPTQTMGKLLNLLDVKLRQCQLGCF